jgi:hypothetical protein
MSILDEDDPMKVKKLILHDQDRNKVVLDKFLQRINFRPHFHSRVVDSNDDDKNIEIINTNPIKGIYGYTS